MNTITKNNEKGFTIIELMIATVVLSVILILVTIVMISIGNLLYKGVNESKIQDFVRNTTKDIDDNIQFSGVTPQLAGPILEGSPPTPVSMYCLGNNKFAFALNQEFGNSTSHLQHVLWRTVTNTFGCFTSNIPDLTMATPSIDGLELMLPRSRLTAFCIGNLTLNKGTGQWQCVGSPASPWTFNIVAAYGDDDQFIPSTLSLPNITCHGGAGDQFCATASLTSTVANRIPAQSD